jgi:hypothetical protein
MEQFAYQRIWTVALQLRTEFGLKDKIKFVFDHHEKQVTESVTKSHLFYKNLSSEYREATAGIPIFEDDESVKPLQAADLFAWVITATFAAKSLAGELSWVQNLDQVPGRVGIWNRHSFPKLIAVLDTVVQFGMMMGANTMEQIDTLRELGQSVDDLFEFEEYTGPDAK